jgi:hypothetical protein
VLNLVTGRGIVPLSPKEGPDHLHQGTTEAKNGVTLLKSPFVLSSDYTPPPRLRARIIVAVDADQRIRVIMLNGKRERRGRLPGA